jgi:hypothetical protein
MRRHPRRAESDPLRSAGANLPGRPPSFGAIGKNVGKGLALRHDHGSQYMADVFQAEIAFFGSRVRRPSSVRQRETAAPNVFIRTLKENLLWVRTFETVEDLRLALLDFRETYNTTWIIERHGYKTPKHVRAEQLQPAAKAA